MGRLRLVNGIYEVQSIRDKLRKVEGEHSIGLHFPGAFNAVILIIALRGRLSLR